VRRDRIIVKRREDLERGCGSAGGAGAKQPLLVVYVDSPGRVFRRLMEGRPDIRNAQQRCSLIAE
jgi:hypothetical protein